MTTDERMTEETEEDGVVRTWLITGMHGCNLNPHVNGQQNHTLMTQ